MSETLKVERLGNGRPGSAIDLVHSPDDGGWYLSHLDFVTKKQRTSVAIYPTRELAVADWHRGAEWEPWY